jgi:hypothetical protein
MTKKLEMSRRQFVTSAAAVTAISALPAGHAIAGVVGKAATLTSPLQSAVALTDNPNWRDQGVENLAKSPHAKLRNIPVRAVTIQNGFWGRRREINVTRSIPTMHDLLEANGRRRLYPGPHHYAPRIWHTTGTPDCQESQQNCGFRLIHSQSTLKGRTLPWQGNNEV